MKLLSRVRIRMPMLFTHIHTKSLLVHFYSALDKLLDIDFTTKSNIHLLKFPTEERALLCLFQRARERDSP